MEVDGDVFGRLLREKVHFAREPFPGNPAFFVFACSNDLPLPVHVHVTVTGRNLAVHQRGMVQDELVDEGKDFVCQDFVAAKKQKKILFRFGRQDPSGKLVFSYAAKVNFGGRTEDVDKEVLYEIPVKEGGVSQGPCEGSHAWNKQSVYAYDFDVPIGTVVHAARGGIVFLVNVIHDTNDPREANRILIAHEDGSVGVYGHLQQQGALVKEGESVEKGQRIALSGNSGISSAPHLHFHVAVPTHEEGWIGVPIKFDEN